MHFSPAVVSIPVARGSAIDTLKGVLWSGIYASVAVAYKAPSAKID